MIEPDEEVLEILDGWIDSVEDGVAYIELKSRSNGDVLLGRYPMEEFTALGVENRFICKTVARGEWTRLEIEPVPDVELTSEDIKNIAEKIRRMFPETDADVIY